MKRKHNHFNLMIVVWLLYLVFHTVFKGKLWVVNLLAVVPSIVYVMITGVLFVYAMFRKGNRNQYALMGVCLGLALVNSDVRMPVGNIFRSVYSDQEQLITVFNWNTHFWESEERLGLLYDFLLEQDADVYMLQEAYYPVDEDFNEYDSISDVERLEYVFSEYEVIYEGEFVLLSKFPVTDYSCEENGYYCQYDVDINGKIISFYNVHMPAQINFEQTKKQFSWDKLLIETRQRHGMRVTAFDKLGQAMDADPNRQYISGDFNTTSAMGMMAGNLHSFEANPNQLTNKAKRLQNDCVTSH